MTTTKDLPEAILRTEGGKTDSRRVKRRETLSRCLTPVLIERQR